MRSHLNGAKLSCHREEGQRPEICQPREQRGTSGALGKRFKAGQALKGRSNLPSAPAKSPQTSLNLAPFSPDPWFPKLRCERMQ
jgi:hypothetical protein